jgi:hypothetical protein
MPLGLFSNLELAVCFLSCMDEQGSLNNLKELIPTVIVVRAGMGFTSEHTTPKLSTASLEFSPHRDRQVRPGARPVSTPDTSIFNIGNNAKLSACNSHNL